VVDDPVGSPDAYERVDRGDESRDVAEIRRGSGPIVGGGREMPSKGLPCRRERLAQQAIMANLRVWLVAADNLQSCAAADRASFEAAQDSLACARELLEGRGPDHVASLGDPRDDIGRRPTVGDDAMHAHRRGQLLAHDTEGGLGDRERVRRVDAQLREHRGMRLAPNIADVEHGDRVERAGEHILRPWMDHQRRVDRVENATLGHQDLPAAVTDLLGGRPDDVKRQVQVIDDGSHAERGPDSRAGNHVVAARMADAG
jgi:hypothetical protein